MKLQKILQAISNKIHEGDTVIRKDNGTVSYKVKSVAGNTITIQDKKYKNVEIAMSINNVKKAKLLTFIDFQNEASHTDLL